MLDGFQECPPGFPGEIRKAVAHAVGAIEDPIQLIDFGPVKVLGIPMEVLLDVAFDWQRRFPEDIALIGGLFGGWIGYLPHRDNFEEPLAEQLYETVCSMFSPEASIVLLEEAQNLVQRNR